MNVALISLAAAVLSALIAAGTTLWRERRRGPDATATLVTASSNAADKMLTQLQARVTALEIRVEHLEDENDRYYRLYGPLPPEQEEEGAAE